jgi:hypothetical protein
MTKSYVGRMFGTYTIYYRSGVFEGDFLGSKNPGWQKRDLYKVVSQLWLVHKA